MSSEAFPCTIVPIPRSPQRCSLLPWLDPQIPLRPPIFHRFTYGFTQIPLRSTDSPTVSHRFTFDFIGWLPQYLSLAWRLVASSRWLGSQAWLFVSRRGLQVQIHCGVCTTARFAPQPRTEHGLHRNHVRNRVAPSICTETTYFNRFAQPHGFTLDLHPKVNDPAKDGTRILQSLFLQIR